MIALVLLLLVGRVVMANDASPYDLVDVIEKDDSTSVGVPIETVIWLLTTAAAVYRDVRA